MAATDNSLARSNKSGKEDKATKKRPAQLSLKPGSPARARARDGLSAGLAATQLE
jgi:hypothetical protein